MSNTEEYKKHQEEPEIDELTKDRYIGGHNYDGIRELDNRMPRWWLYLFYLTIVFAVVYLLGYHVTNWWPNQNAEYAIDSTEVAALKQTKPQQNIDLESMVPLTAPQDLALGEDTYKKICSACHAAEGQGLVGPNFTDQYWIHGDTVTNTIGMKNLYKVVVDGVIEKGMIPYKDQLSPQQIQQVLSYILTLQGTNPPNPKAPQGKKYDKIG